MQHSNTAGCILLKFYIKPQHTANVYNLLYVVSYRNSTSNHNRPNIKRKVSTLYLIEILHQTTTDVIDILFTIKLYLIEILHQTTTARTSNGKFRQLYLIEILHQTTTVRPLCTLCRPLYLIEILHQTTTHCRRAGSLPWLYLIEILHQTTTSGLILIDKVLLTGCLPL